MTDTSHDPHEGPRSSREYLPPVRWWLVTILFGTGVGLWVIAFRVHARGTDELLSSALLDLGASIGLVGVLFVAEGLLVRHIVAAQREAVTLNCFARKVGGGADAWDAWTVARPGDELELLLEFKNSGETTLRDVSVGNNLPKYLSYVAGSTQLRNGANPGGIAITSDNITHGGVDVGSYKPGAVGYVWLRAQVDRISAFDKIGTYDLRNVGVVRPAGMNEYYNVAKILVDVPEHTS
jgi:uncharacterized repeat protein (TIGR01451 family)